MPKGQRIKPEQIVMLLRQVEVLTANGKTLAQACKEVGVGEQNYYRWRKMYGGMEIDQAKKYKELEQENTRLKKLVADLSKSTLCPMMYSQSLGNRNELLGGQSTSSSSMM